MASEDRRNAPATARDRAVARFALVWAMVGLATTGTVMFLVVPTGLSDPWRVAAVGAITALGEALELRFQWSERASSSFTLVEAGVVAALLLLPGAEALLATVGAVALIQVLRRRPPLKAGFNLGQLTASVALAALIVAVLPTIGPQVAGRAILSVTLGMAAYGAVNLAALTGLLERLTGQAPTETLRDHGALTAAAIAGNTAVGVLAAALWTTQPELLPALLAPTAAIHLAYRGTVRTDTLLARARAEAERLDRIVLGTSDGIVLLDGEGTVEVWNAAMEQMTGIDAREAVGSPVERVLTPDLRDGDPVSGRWVMEDATVAAPTHHHLVGLHPREGSDRTVRESHTLIFDDRERCIGDVILLHDVTRQQELEALKGDFVARISHELRTPLTPIKGFAQVLLKRADDLTPDQRHDALQRIDDHATRLTGLVEDLLLVSTLDREDVREIVTTRPVDVAAVARETVMRFRSRHPDRLLTFSVGSPDEGTSGRSDPSSRDGIRAVVDPERVEQILKNLLDNAVRYTPPETPIEVECFTDGDDILLRVIDHGPGIPFDKQETIFERFHRLEDPLRMRTSGVGLGLFLARRLARAMHGSLTVDSSSCEPGATFVLRVPCADVATGTTTKTPRPPAAERPAPGTHTPLG